MKNFKPLLITLCLLLIGCSHKAAPKKAAPQIFTLGDVGTQNAEKLLKLNVGMSKADVLALMGTETIQTYTHREKSLSHFREPSLKIANPYRTETVKAGDKYFEVLFYYTDINNNQSVITDHDLTPLIFDDSKLIGWGWRNFEAAAQKYQIELKVR